MSSAQAAAQAARERGAASRRRLLDSSGKPDYKAIIQPTLQYELYNPSNKAIEFAYDNCTYRIPAAHENWVGIDPSDPALGKITYPEPGVMPVWSPIGKRYTAADIVKFACGLDGRTGRVLGIRGVRPLFGEEEEINQLVKQEAQEAYLERQMLIVNQGISAYEQGVAEDTAEGRPPRMMPTVIREFYEQRRAWQTLPSTRFACPVCRWQLESEDATWVHILAYHKDHPNEVAEATERMNEALLAAGERTITGQTGGADIAEPLPGRGHLPSAGEVEDALSAAERGETGSREPVTASRVDPSDPASILEQRVREGSLAQARGGRGRK